MKKLLIVLVVIIILLSLGAILFWFFGSGQEKSLNTPVETFPTGGEASFPGQSENSGESQGTDGISGGEQAFPNAEPGNQGRAGEVIARGIKQISAGPVIGAMSFGTTKDSNLTVRFLEKGTGYIYDYDILEGKAKKVSGTTIPKVSNVLWGNSGQSIFLQYTDKDGALRNYLANVASASGTPGVSGEFLAGEITSAAESPTSFEVLSCAPLLNVTLEKSLPNDPNAVRKLQRFLVGEGYGDVKETGIFDDITFKAVVSFQEEYRLELLTPLGLSAGTGSVGPATRKKINEISCRKEGARVTGRKFVYLSKQVTADYAGVITDFDSGESRNIFSSPFGEWHILWPNETTLVFVTKPDSMIMGNAYLAPIPTKNSYSLMGTVEPLMRDIFGLTVSVNAKVDRVIYGEANVRGYSTKILDRSSGETRPFPIATIPSEKCVWDRLEDNLVYCAGPKTGLGENTPEAWYFGLRSYSDNIYAIDTDTDTANLIYSPLGDGPDVSEIFLAKDGSVLFFIDKRDGSLWALSLSER